MAVKLLKEQAKRTYRFDGKMEVSKPVMEVLGDDISPLVEVIADIRKRASEANGIKVPELTYELEDGIVIKVKDKISVEEMESDQVERLYKTRNHLFSITLAK